MPTIPEAAWRARSFNDKKQYMERVRLAFRGVSSLSKFNCDRIVAPLGAAWPYRLDMPPCDSDCRPFLKWICCFPRTWWDNIVSDFRSLGGVLTVDEVFLESLDKVLRRGAEWDGAWTALRSSALSRLRKDTSGYRPLFSDAAHDLFELSGTIDLTVCGRVSFEEACNLIWRDVSTLSAPVVRLALLQATGCEHLVDLQAHFDAQQEVVKEYREIPAKPGGCYNERFADYTKLAQLLGSPPRLALATLSSAEFATRLQSEPMDRHQASRCYTVLKWIASQGDSSSQLDEIKRLLPCHFLRTSKFDWAKGLSAWHEAAFADIEARMLAYHNTTFFPETMRAQVQKRIGENALFLRVHVVAEQKAGRFETGDTEPFRWFVENCTQDMVRDAILARLRAQSVRNEKVRTSQNVHHCSQRVHEVISFYKNGLRGLFRAELDFGPLDAKSFLAQVVNQREPADTSRRRTYSDQEIAALFLVCKDDVRWTLILTILREVGLRVNCVSHLKYYMLLDETHTPRHVCRVPEKAKTWRSFVTSPRLKSATKTYSEYLRKRVSEIDPNIYLLNEKTPNQPLSAQLIRNGLKDMSEAAGITDVSVYPHAFRATIVGELVAAGNPMELVSKWMGHANISTTATHYYVPTVIELQTKMNNPFTGHFQREMQATEELEERLSITTKKLDAALRLLCEQTGILRAASAQGVSATAALERFEQRIPDAEEIFRCIIAPTMPSTASASGPAKEWISEGAPPEDGSCAHDPGDESDDVAQRVDEDTTEIPEIPSPSRPRKRAR